MTFRRLYCHIRAPKYKKYPHQTQNGGPAVHQTVFDVPSPDKWASKGQ